jgi:hypothetical protein
MTRDGLGDCYGDFGFRWGCTVRYISLNGDFDPDVGTILKQGAVDGGVVSLRSDGVASA